MTPTNNTGDMEWLLKVFNDHDCHTDIYGKHRAWMQDCQTCQTAIQQHIEDEVRKVLNTERKATLGMSNHQRIDRAIALAHEQGYKQCLEDQRRKEQLRLTTRTEKGGQE